MLHPASQNMLRLAGFTGLMQVGDHENAEEAMSSARSLMDKCLPLFNGASLIAKNDSRAVGAIPLEAYETVLDWYLALLDNKGIEGLLNDLGEEETMTELAWQHLKAL